MPGGLVRFWARWWSGGDERDHESQAKIAGHRGSSLLSLNALSQDGPFHLFYNPLIKVFNVDRLFYSKPFDHYSSFVYASIKSRFSQSSLEPNQWRWAKLLPFHSKEFTIGGWVDAILILNLLQTERGNCTMYI